MKKLYYKGVRKTVRERFRNRRYENEVRQQLKVSGMACSMCEAHINDAIRATFSVERFPHPVQGR